MTLFKRERFKSHSGAMLDFKIECDAFTPDDWEGLAWIVRQRLPAYRTAIGIPRGGTPFAEALGVHCNPKTNIVLLADDVWTTGYSMREWRERLADDIGIVDPNDRVIGVVAFARSRPDAWVTAAFVLGEVTAA